MKSRSVSRLTSGFAVAMLTLAAGLMMVPDTADAGRGGGGRGGGGGMPLPSQGHGPPQAGRGQCATGPTVTAMP